MSSSRGKWRTRLAALVVAVGLHSLSDPCVAASRVMLGFLQNEADKYGVEFRQYDRRLPVFRQHDIDPSLVSFEPLYAWDWSEDRIYQLLKTYHAVVLITTEGAPQTVRLTPELVARGKTAGAALARYVNDGGGLFVEEQSVRYPNTDDEKYWNVVLAPLGITILHEGCFDPAHSYQDTILGQPFMYWFTKNVRPHPVTAGVERLYLPLHTPGGFYPGVSAIRYSPEWQVVVSGETEAKSFRSTEDDCTIQLDRPGSYASAPPVVVVRQLGKGRIVSFPLAGIESGANYGHPLWKNTFESAGNRNAELPSSGLTLLVNCYRWIAEPAQATPGFGTHVDPPYQAVRFPSKVEFDSLRFGQPEGGIKGYEYPDGQKPEFAPPGDGVRGIIGAHTSYTDGKGTVADYAKAARAAGLSFLVFNDPLEQLTKEKLSRLKADCAAASDAGFYACPGIEFTDGVGNRWAFWGEKVLFPSATFKEDNKTYPLWDGQRVVNYGAYMNQCSFVPSALLDYRQLPEHGVHRENLWWFYNYLAFAYDKTTRIADNSAEYLFGLRDLRWASVDSFSRVTAPSEVAAAARACFTGFKDLASAHACLNACLGAWGASAIGRQYASQGPVIATWDAIDSQMENNWETTRGAQRVRLKFIVRSDAGIAEVKVHDADTRILRRFLGHGAKELTREFELVNDQQHYLVLEAVDTRGQRAFSWYQFVFSYKQGLIRCGDNLNILSGAGLIWMPNAGELLPAAKPFENVSDANIPWGWDGCPGSPKPTVLYNDRISTSQGVYPDWYKDGVSGSIVDMRLSSYNLQIASVRKAMLSEAYCVGSRPSYAVASLPRDKGPLAYYTRSHTIYVPMTRMDNYTAWNYRRPREGAKDYRGGLMWHEGEFIFTRDVTLKGDVPIDLAELKCPTDIEKGWGTALVVKEQANRSRFALLRSPDQPIALSGTLHQGGYATIMPSLVGYQGFMVPPGHEYTYTASLGPNGGVRIGLGHDGERVKAGTVLRYQYAVGTFAEPNADNSRLEETVSTLNLAGGKSGYPFTMKVGRFIDGIFFFTARAAKDESAFTIGPRDLIIDLPFRVQGLEDNGCAAVYSTKRPWFRFVPVVDGTAWFQEPILPKNELWVGNIFVCDNQAVKIAVVVDGQADGKPPLVELHNPTDRPIETRVWSPAHTPRFGGMSDSVKLPAGDSLFFTVHGKQLVPKI